MVKCIIYCNVLQTCSIRTFFFIFVSVFPILLFQILTRVVFFYAACWPSYGPKQENTFSTLQKSRFWARSHMISLHARARKPSEKNGENAFRRALIVYNTIVGKWNHMLQKTQKWKNLKTQRIESATLKGPWRGRVKFVFGVRQFYAKTFFLQKNLIFNAQKVARGRAEAPGEAKMEWNFR